MGTFFGDYVAMVTPIGKKSNRTPFPTEPHVLMYVLRGWRKRCGTSCVSNSCYVHSRTHSHTHARTHTKLRIGAATTAQKEYYYYMFIRARFSLQH